MRPVNAWDDFNKLRSLLGEMGHTSQQKFATLRKEALAAAHRLALAAVAGEKRQERSRKQRHTYSPKSEAKARAEAAARLRSPET